MTNPYDIYGVAGFPQDQPIDQQTMLPLLQNFRQQNGMETPPYDVAMQMPASALQSPQTQQPQPAAGSNSLMDEILGEYVKTMRANQGGGGNLIQQILSSRMQPNMQDIGQSGIQSLNGLINHDISKVPTPEAAMADRWKSQLTPYADAATIAKTQQENKFAPYTTYATLLNAQTAANGGPTGALVNTLLPKFGGDPRAVLQYLKGGANQGTMMENGQIVPIAGSLETAQAQAQAKASGHETGTEGAKANMILPTVISNAEQQLKLIDDVKNDPNLKYYTGLGSLIPPIPGTPLASLDAKAKQILGKNFMVAYEGLKGGGAITEVEGQKATDAMGRMQRSQSTEDYIAALDDLRDVVFTGIQRSKTKASMANPGAKPSQPNMSGATHSYNRQTGQLEAVQ